MAAFEQWKTSSIQKGKYATAANCKMEIVTKDGYKGPNTGIPQISLFILPISMEMVKLDGLFLIRCNVMAAMP